MRAWTNLEYAEIGSYKPGCLYSESFAGVPYESDLLLPKGVGRTDYKAPGGLLKTMRLIVLLHETSHLVHDLSLGTCMDADFLLDQSDALFKATLRDMQYRVPGGVRCPILSAENRGQWLADAKWKDAFAAIERIEAYENKLVGCTPGLARYALSLSPAFQAVQDSLASLSGLALQEGLVATKTASTLAARVENGADRAYLKANRESLRVLPESLPEVYQIAQRVFHDTVGRVLLRGRAYYQDAWPDDSPLSLRRLSDIGFVYLADMALHIPPRVYQEERITTGRNSWEDFIPVMRFCRMIATLLRWGKFPMGDTNPEFFYNELFDALAGDQVPCWPTINETNHAWKVQLAFLKVTRREATDGYRFRMLVEREKRPHSMIMGDAMSACWSQLVPVFHLTRNGFKALQVFVIENRWYIAPVETKDMAINEFFHADHPLWKDIPDGVRFGTGNFSDIHLNNVRLLRQEVIYRTFCRELYTALLCKNSLACPFALQGCPTAQPGCKNITDLAAIPHAGCCLYDYLKQNDLDATRIHWL
jgi:hypothetical protein